MPVLGPVEVEWLQGLPLHQPGFDLGNNEAGHVGKIQLGDLGQGEPAEVG